MADQLFACATHGEYCMPAGTWSEIVEANVLSHGELVVGIDPYLPDIPAVFERETDGTGWLPRYLDFVLETIIGEVGFIKFQSAFFEAYGLAGLSALSPAMQRARAAGLGVILDAKRGDIGSTAAAYAR